MYLLWNLDYHTYQSFVILRFYLLWLERYIIASNRRRDLFITAEKEKASTVHNVLQILCKIVIWKARKMKVYILT